MGVPQRSGGARRLRHPAGRQQYLRFVAAITASIPYEYLNAVPAERVAQIHIAGHSKFEKYILDTHDHPVIDPVWKLYEHAIRRAGPTATLLEWDDRIPSFDEVHAEALKAEPNICRRRRLSAL